MAKSKRDIDKEIMFNKIMPSGTPSANIASAIDLKQKLDKPSVGSKNSSGDDLVVPPGLSNNEIQPTENKNQEEIKTTEKTKNIVEKDVIEKTDVENKVDSVEEQAEPEIKKAEIKETTAVEPIAAPAKAIKAEKVSEKVEIVEEKAKDSSSNSVANCSLNEVSKATIMVNLCERMVLKKIDAAFDKFSKCKCYCCKQDVIAMALNTLKPKYIITTADDIEKIVENEDYAEVTAAIMKAILHVKTHSRH